MSRVEQFVPYRVLKNIVLLKGTALAVPQATFWNAALAAEVRLSLSSTRLERA